MTNVTIDNNQIIIKGHAGDHDVCCMVSTLLNAFLYSAADKYHIRFDSYVTSDGYAEINDLHLIRNDVAGAVLLDSFIYCLQLLEEDFPDYVKVEHLTT